MDSGQMELHLTFAMREYLLDLLMNRFAASERLLFADHSIPRKKNEETSYLIMFFFQLCSEEYHIEIQDG